MNIPESVWGGLAGSAGTLIIYLLQRWITAPSRKKKIEQTEIKHQQVIDEANLKLAATLREEMRKDNIELRERQVSNETRIDSLVTDNQGLRKENMELKGENGALREKAESAEKKIANLEMVIRQMQNERIILIDAMRQANVPLPVEMYKIAGV